MRTEHLSERQRAHIERLAEKRRGSITPAWVGAKISAGKKGKQRGSDNPNYKRGWLLLGGYKYVLARDHPNCTQLGYVAEHRIVMEKHLGRYLEPSEAVHHKDHNPLNNDIDNLELCASNGRHTMEHHAVRNSKGQFSCA